MPTSSVVHAAVCVCRVGTGEDVALRGSEAGVTGSRLLEAGSGRAKRPGRFAPARECVEAEWREGRVAVGPRNCVALRRAAEPVSG